MEFWPYKNGGSQKHPVIGGFTAALVCATAEVLKIEPCREKMLCWRRGQGLSKKLFVQTFANVWGELFQDARHKIEDMLVEELYIQRECNGDPQAAPFAMPMTQMDGVKEELLDDWRLRHLSDRDEGYRLAIRLFQLPTPISKEFMEACVAYMPSQLRIDLGHHLFHTLLRCCKSVRLSVDERNQPVLNIQYTVTDPVVAI